MSQGNPPYPPTGTTTPIYIAKSSASKAVRPGEYFIVKVHQAQAAFRGSGWQRAKQLLVTSKVNYNHPVLGREEIYGLQRKRKVERQQDVSLGLSSNLISLVPAIMDHVSISIEFVLDLENHLAKIGTLINNEDFLAVVSLAPGASAVAKTVSGLAQKVIQTFIPADEQKPILQFAGDFNISAQGEDLRDGYYVILGSYDEQNPLPGSSPDLTVTKDSLLAGGQKLSNLSYVVLDVIRAPARTRKAGDKSPWDVKLREAERMVEEFINDPFPDATKGQAVWAKCVPILHDADTLIKADPNYTLEEAGDIVRTVYQWCAKRIVDYGSRKGRVSGTSIQTDTPSDRAQLGIAESEDLEAVVASYSQRADEASRILDTVE